MRLRSSILPHIFLRVLVLGALALVLVLVAEEIEERFHITIASDITPYEVAGGALSLLLILRTNAGYDRWWEGRRLWGGIVNQLRNLVLGA